VPDDQKRAGVGVLLIQLTDIRPGLARESLPGDILCEVSGLRRAALAGAVFHWLNGSRGAKVLLARRQNPDLAIVGAIERAVFGCLWPGFWRRNAYLFIRGRGVRLNQGAVYEGEVLEAFWPNYP
jgi:hypothetical protein